MGKTAVITGGARGIGAAIAGLFAERGFQVVINYRSSEEKAGELVKALTEKGCSAVSFCADVRSTAQIKQMFVYAYDRFGSIDVLVNNAGIARQQVLSDVTDSDWEEIMEINAGGVFRCSREVLPYMLKKHTGSILNISSMWGVCGASCESVYSASKAAVNGFTKALAKELGPSGIRVNAIAPGVIDTDMNAALSGQTMRELAEETPLMRIGTPAEVAEAAYFLASDSSSFITGQILGVNGGFVI